MIGHREQPIPRQEAFTLIELLVVMLIIGILAAISIPALKGIGQGNRISAATQQLMNDLSLARQRAIVNRTTVHVVFVPPTIDAMDDSTMANPDKRLLQRLRSGPYTTYALYAERTAGDQPGQRTDRYLTQWRSLPEGVFIAEAEYGPAANWPVTEPPDGPFEFVPLPFPSAEVTTPQTVPHVAFDRNGALIDAAGRRRFNDEYIWLTKGSVLPLYDVNGEPTSVDVRESPPGNWMTNFNRIHIDALTGRAKLERPEIQ